MGFCLKQEKYLPVRSENEPNSKGKQVRIADPIGSYFFFKFPFKMFFSKKDVLYFCLVFSTNI